MTSKISQTIAGLFRDHGDSEYGGEAVTQKEHALQCAALAEAAGATADVIVAAMLHDVGHLLHGLPDDAPQAGVDDVHEVLGERWLQNSFPDSVVDPAKLHVAAKRYLCAVDEGYFDCLSEPSVVSLKLQGGPMSPAEISAFEAEPHFKAAVALRRWDDEAKVVGKATPDLEHFLPLIDAVAHQEPS